MAASTSPTSRSEQREPLRLDADDATPVYVISVAAALSGMHAQTLRQYDRLGLVTPSRTRGGGRRYSPRDVTLLREIQRLSQEGVSLEGIARIMELENQVIALRQRVAELSAQARTLAAGIPAPSSRVFSVSPTGDVYAVRPGERPRHHREQSVVLWRPTR